MPAGRICGSLFASGYGGLEWLKDPKATLPHVLRPSGNGGGKTNDVDEPQHGPFQLGFKGKQDYTSSILGQPYLEKHPYGKPSWAEQARAGENTKHGAHV